MPKVVDCFGEENCEYCGTPWHEDSDQYNGGCCIRDELHAPDDLSLWGNADDFERERGSDDHMPSGHDLHGNADEFLRRWNGP